MKRKRVAICSSIAVVLWHGLAATPAVAASCDPFCEKGVIAGNQKFEGQAVLYIPGRGKVVGASSGGGTCAGCEWALVIACQGNGTPGGADQDNLCNNANLRCQARGGQLFRLYFRPSADVNWREVDSVCIGVGADPVTPADIATALRKPFEKLVPGQRPGYQPAGGALVNLPTIFYAGQPRRTSGSVRVLGFDVSITAKSTWTWRFEPNSAQVFTTPGAPYPSKDVTYTYRSTGPRKVVLSTTWSGSYTIEGEGPFAIAQPVIQTSPPLDVPVFQARGQLVGGARN